MKTLFVVESPNKIKKVTEILNKLGMKDAEVVATKGHFMEPIGWSKMKVIDYKTKRMLQEKFRQVMYNNGIVYIATDNDREGEGIAYEIYKVLYETAKKLKRRFEYKRVRLGAITYNDIKRGLETADKIDMKRVEAWKTRVYVDRMIGFKLTRKSQKEVAQAFDEETSVGRVVTFALGLVEKAHYLATKYGKPLVQYVMGARCHGSGYFNLVQTKFASKSPERKYKVQSVSKRNVKASPPAGFNTASLIKAAGSKLGMSAGATMRTAQKLFEKGLITYHRTQSVCYSTDAVDIAREVYNLQPTNMYIDKLAEHEAIRPTGEQPVGLSKAEQKLYQLILDRFKASMSQPALYEETKVVVQTPRGNEFVGYGYKLKFKGWTKYEKPNIKLQKIPETVVEGRTLEGKPTVLKRVIPPYKPLTDADVVVNLRENGVGRPSTYSAMTQALLKKGYVIKRQGRLYLTELGKDLLRWVKSKYRLLLDKKFTSEIEEALDKIEKTGDYEIKNSLIKKIQAFVEGHYESKTKEEAVIIREKMRKIEGEKFEFEPEEMAV